MRTSIIILNWNTRDLLRRFIPGILDSIRDEDAELVVADNGSTDGSVEMLHESFPKVRVMAFDRNYGFTGGYNKAISQIESEFCIMMNSDIEVGLGWFRPLIEALYKDPQIGACAPKLHSIYERDRFEYAGAAGGYIDRFGFPFCRGRIMSMTENDNGQYDGCPEGILWATGACLLVRTALYKRLGGLDDRFFAHMEEIDLCWRLQLEGYKIRIVPQSIVYHLGGASLPKSSPFKLQLNFRNNLLLLSNNLAKTFALEMAAEEDNRMMDEAARVKEKKDQTIADKAVRKARRVIFLRKVIDGLIAAAYLIALKPARFKAVLLAHRQYDKMKNQITVSPEYIRRMAGLQIRGIYKGFIVLETVIYGKRIFDHLHGKI